MLERIHDWWRARQRRMDILILWPQCCELAPDLDRAKMAFAMHAFNDPAWQWLGPDEIKRQIDALKDPRDGRP